MFVSLSIFLWIFTFFVNIFFQPSFWKLISLPVLMLESKFFNAILIAYKRWFPENFVMICLKLTLKISFEKLGKNTDFWKSQKKIEQNGWRKTSFFKHFLNSWVLRKRRKVRHSQSYEKKVKITASPWPKMLKWESENDSRQPIDYLRTRRVTT